MSRVCQKQNYASIDARIPAIGAFQMTVGKKHDMKGGIADDLAMLGEAKRYSLLCITTHSPKNCLKILSNT